MGQFDRLKSHRYPEWLRIVETSELEREAAELGQEKARLEVLNPQLKASKPAQDTFGGFGSYLEETYHRLSWQTEAVAAELERRRVLGDDPFAPYQELLKTELNTEWRRGIYDVLHAAWKRGTPEVRRTDILNQLGRKTSNLKSTLRRWKLWGTLIVPGTPSTIRLKPDPPAGGERP